jgi:hypothetical protein
MQISDREITKYELQRIYDDFKKIEIQGYHMVGYRKDFI